MRRPRPFDRHSAIEMRPRVKRCTRLDTERPRRTSSMDSESASRSIRTGEPCGRILAARCAGELRPLRILAQRTRAIGAGVCVDRREPCRRLTLLDPGFERLQRLELRVERAEAVAEAGNYVEAEEAVQSRLAE